MWVDKHRGGLICVGGPVNTFQLTRGLNTEKVKPVLDMLPVVLDDNRIYSLDRSTAEPWRLNFPGATAEMEFLKLDEDNPDQRDVLAGWEAFFTGKDKHDGGRDITLKRGFFDFYPVREVKTSATVIGTFSDPRARLKDGKEQPYIVAMPWQRAATPSGSARAKSGGCAVQIVPRALTSAAPYAGGALGGASWWLHPATAQRVPANKVYASPPAWTART